MDFFVKGNIWIANEAQLAALLETQKAIRVVPVTRGALARGDYGEGFSKFDIEIRTNLVGGALTYFNELKALLIAQNIAGTIYWHECHHDEGAGGCQHNDTYTHLTGG